MRTAFHIMAAAMLLLALGSGPAAAFKETATEHGSTLSGTPSGGAGLTFDIEQPKQETEAAPKSDPSIAKKSEGGLQLKGTGSLDIRPKLNFGLELLYSAPDDSDSSAPAFTEPDTDDFSIMGKIRRRF